MDLTPLFKIFPLRTWLLIAAAVALLALVLAWGQSRYDAGVADADARWKAAGEKLAADARRSSDAATRREAPRLAAHAAQVAEEKEKIDEALADGRSPLDALFPAAGGVRDDADRRGGQAAR